MLALPSPSGPEEAPLVPRPARPDASRGRLRFAAHLAPARAGETAGTFVATGLVADSGVLAPVERFAGLGTSRRAPVVVAGAETFAGAAGRVAIAYDGVFRVVDGDVYVGEGAWRVTGGDHAYGRLSGEGSWTATAVVSGGRLTVDAVFDGAGSLH